jgi:malonyl-ACP decarboxylase
LRRAGLSAADIDYINPHGSGSLKGDESEIQAIRASGLSHARINATKSLVGHGLTSAGAVEIVATVMQMSEARLHPTRNLEEPIDTALRWVKEEAEPHIMGNALSLSFGFGGINTALCLSRVTPGAGRS